jgi:beta-lactamase superfamily II metal-dependent hydrolase
MSTDSVPRSWNLPDEWFDAQSRSFVEAIQPDDLVYFLLNVGDGDTQLLLLPERPDGRRRAIVVDVATTAKLPPLLNNLAKEGLLSIDAPEVLPLVVGTHPHSDHMGGMPELLHAFGDGGVGQYWDPGYLHPSGPYVETMIALEEHPDIRYLQPTSGTTCFIDSVKVTVLTPGIGLRGRFDTYGVAINDASLTVKVEYPASRVARGVQKDPRYENRSYLDLGDPWALLLGGDAQHTSWAQATVDFPELHRHHDADLYRQMRDAVGRDTLRSHILKVPHHASKRGVNLELVERVKPRLTLISSVAGGGRYNFPHPLAVEAIREALDPTGLRTGPRERNDWDLGIHCTGARTPDDGPAGSLAVRIPRRRGRRLDVWRFRDSPRARIRLDDGRRLAREY